ncbi:hypothetical protein MMC30_000396 [Trapelia coarctata]|nr:hypothetical protein [Trapelia coarctata]
MVSLWPWKADDTSPASFEKTLSALSSKIAKASSRLEGSRQQGRRFKGLWTLYSSFVYLLYVVVVGLVVGWRNWGPVEYTAISGGPLVIYAIRLGLTTFYDYRTSKLQANFNALQKQREAAINKLKAATKYDTTQQLLEKYGGTPSKSKSGGQSARKTTPNQSTASGPQIGRTGFAPPATANIPGRTVPASLPSTPQRSTPLPSHLGPAPPRTAAAVTPPWQQKVSPGEQTAEFAPNAFSAPAQYAQIGSGLKWYDRFMDLLLGEDETNPKNRLVLICKKCRLVNGQAPPGVKTLEDVGKWRCAECGTMNGEESDAKKLVAEIQKSVVPGDNLLSSQNKGHPMSPSDEEEVVLVGHDEEQGSDHTIYSDEPPEENEDTIRVEPEPEKPKRGRPKGSGKKKS